MFHEQPTGHFEKYRTKITSNNEYAALTYHGRDVRFTFNVGNHLGEFTNIALFDKLCSSMSYIICKIFILGWTFNLFVAFFL